MAASSRHRGSKAEPTSASGSREVIGFRSFPRLLAGDDIALLRDECLRIFDAKSKKSSTAYSEGQTFWIGADAQPRLLAEAYALHLFAYYTKGVRGVDLSQSGAEFWPLCIDVADANVAAHYDKDYGSEDRGQHVYPNVGTVTYLSEHGAPTVFFHQLEHSPLPCQINSGWLSRVLPGKHVAFDGRLLHCASSQLLTGGSKRATGQRVTFLVNVWINHVPLDPVPCPFVAAEPLPERAFPPFPAAERMDRLVVPADGLDIEMPMENKTALRFKAPLLAATQSTSVELSWPPGAAQVVKLNKKKEQASARKAKTGRR